MLLGVRSSSRCVFLVYRNPARLDVNDSCKLCNLLHSTLLVHEVLSFLTLTTTAWEKADVLPRRKGSFHAICRMSEIFWSAERAGSCEKHNTKPYALLGCDTCFEFWDKNGNSECSIRSECKAFMFAPNIVSLLLSCLCRFCISLELWSCHKLRLVSASEIRFTFLINYQNSPRIWKLQVCRSGHHEIGNKPTFELECVFCFNVL